ncbi:p360_13L [African swine fever virus]|uniref:p360_13L n=1 Tax=African swine fever virus TaxID=10497 RepID=A0A8A1V479_ASF|nr:p360_13L [African swine fever virus]
MYYIMRIFPNYGYVFCFIFLYKTAYFFGVLYVYWQGSICAANIQSQTMAYKIISFLFRYGTTLFKGITTQIYTEKYITDVILLYCSMHTLVVVASQGVSVLYCYWIVILGTSQTYHVMDVYLDFFLVVHLMQLIYFVTIQETFYSPFITIRIFLFYKANGVLTLVLYCFGVPILHYYIVYLIRFFYFYVPPYSFTNYAPYLYTIFVFYITIIHIYIMAYNITAAGFIVHYLGANTENIVVFYSFFGAYLSTQLSDVLRIITKQTILVMCAPFCTELYQTILVFLISYYYCYMEVYIFSYKSCFYLYLATIHTKLVGHIMPPYVTVFQNAVFICRQTLAGYRLFVEGLQRERQR